jgi:hypothetical protein
MLDPDIQGRLEGLPREHLMAVFDCLLGPRGEKDPSLRPSPLLSIGLTPEKDETPGVDRGLR